MTVNEKINPPWYREPYVWLLITFPLAAVIGGIITIMLAVQSDDGLVVDDYYKKGLEINRTLERDRQAKLLGLDLSIQYGTDLPEVRVFLIAGNKFEYPESLQLSFLNASRDGMDQKLEFKKNPDNSYTAANPGLARGKWHVLVEQDDWRLLEVLQVP